MAAFGAIASETEDAADVRHVSPAVFEDGAWRCEPIADRATADADAGERGDASGEATIPAGERCAAIEIAIADDADVEPAREWFAVELELRQPHDRSARLRRSRIPVAVLEGVCDRTPAARDARLAAAAVGAGCERPAPADLTPIQTLALDGPEPATMLATGDLSGLPGLRTLPRLRDLDLSDNALRTLPDAAFAGLSSLRLLRLDGNPGAGARRRAVRFGAEPVGARRKVLEPLGDGGDLGAGGRDRRQPTGRAAGRRVRGGVRVRAEPASAAVPRRTVLAGLRAGGGGAADAVRARAAGADDAGAGGAVRRHAAAAAGVAGRAGGRRRRTGVAGVVVGSGGGGPPALGPSGSKAGACPRTPCPAFSAGFPARIRLSPPSRWRNTRFCLPSTPVGESPHFASFSLGNPRHHGI